MSKPKYIKLLAAFILIALVVAGWIYVRDYKYQAMLIRADQRIESGVTLFKEGKYSEALKVFENVLPGSSREWYARYYQGSTYILLKDYESAIPFLEQALSLNPTETQVMHALGVAYFKLGNLKMSKAYYAAILAINPDDTEARGLMEIMTDLEKRQSEVNEPESKVASNKELEE